MAMSIERATVRELKCLLCGYTLGEMVTVAGQRMFRRAPDCPPPEHRRLSDVRCPRCGGAVYLEGAESTSCWAPVPPRAASALRQN